MDAIYEYDISSVSMVVESLRPLDQTEFVSVGLCEMGHTKQAYDELDDIMKELSGFINHFFKLYYLIMHNAHRHFCWINENSI